MKYFDEADKLSKELAQVLVHNKYLLDDIASLEVALYSRFLTAMGEAFENGKGSVMVNDYSYSGLTFQKGTN